MAINETLGSYERFNNNKIGTIGFQSARTIGFQQQTNKLYMEAVWHPINKFPIPFSLLPKKSNKKYFDFFILFTSHQ
jgi:hypothetical protein